MTEAQIIIGHNNKESDKMDDLALSDESLKGFSKLVQAVAKEKYMINRFQISKEVKEQAEDIIKYYSENQAYKRHKYFYTRYKVESLEVKSEVKADGTTTDGIPSKTKVLGILPNEL